MNENFGTLSQSINALIGLGYTHDFNIQDECLVCRQSNMVLSPNDFQIDKVYRFEGVSDPDDQSILYAISSRIHYVKGTLVNGYGISAVEEVSKAVELLQTNQAPSVAVETSSVISTDQRPEGGRILNARSVEMNLSNFIDQIKKEKIWTDSDRNSITIFKSEVLRVVLLGMHENSETTPHAVNGVMTLQVLKGEVRVIAEQQSHLLETDQMIALHANIIHRVIALKESFLLLTLAINNSEV